MSPAPLSPRTVRVLAVAALTLPLLSLASLAGAALWVRGHGGLAAQLTALARHAAYFAAGTGALPGTLSPAQAATLAPPAPAAGYVWIAGGDARDRDFSFALVEPGKGSTMCFDSDRGSAAFRRLSRSATTPTVWFTDDGREYTITDRALVERARGICAPLGRIGGEMGRVGAKMGERGARLGAMGGRLGALGGRLGGLSAQLATSRVSPGERDRLEAELAEVRAEMERVQSEMERVDSAHGDDRDALSTRMRTLGDQHREALREARVELRKLLDEARATGKAQRFGEGGGSI